MALRVENNFMLHADMFGDSHGDNVKNLQSQTLPKYWVLPIDCPGIPNRIKNRTSQTHKGKINTGGGHIRTEKYISSTKKHFK